jgi:hypothetical protein
MEFSRLRGISGYDKILKRYLWPKFEETPQAFLLLVEKLLLAVAH